MIKRHPFVSYAILALAFTWACWLPLVVGRAVVRPGAWPTHVPGLFGPALAGLLVTAVVAGRSGVRELARGLVRWRIGLWPWLLVASPLLLFGATVLVTGERPAWSELGEMNGFPIASPLALWLMVVVVNGFGEEIGWRGFAFVELRRRHGLLPASLLVAPVWALWHLPSFLVLETYRGLGPGDLVGFAIGIASGAVMLGWLYEKSGRSLLAVALWHGTFNLFSATRGSRGVLAAVETTGVIVLALAVAIAEIRTHRRRRVAGAPS